MSQVNPIASAAGKNIKAFGVVTLILGFLAIMAPLYAGKLIAVMVGALVLVAGVFRVVWAFHARTLGHGVILFLLGGLTILCGLMMVTDPIFASGVLTFLISFYFFVEGISELAAATQSPGGKTRGLLILDGILSLLLGILIWSQFPLSGAWAIGILLGIKLIFIGVIMLAVGQNALNLGKDETILEVPSRHVEA